MKNGQDHQISGAHNFYCWRHNICFSTMVVGSFPGINQRMGRPWYSIHAHLESEDISHGSNHHMVLSRNIPISSMCNQPDIPHTIIVFCFRIYHDWSIFRWKTLWTNTARVWYNRLILHDYFEWNDTFVDRNICGSFKSMTPLAYLKHIRQCHQTMLNTARFKNPTKYNVQTAASGWIVIVARGVNQKLSVPQGMVKSTFPYGWWLPFGSYGQIYYPHGG